MPAVAEVQFKAAGSQQVVSAFNSVGSAAQSSSTKVQQNSTAMSSLGKGMKSSVAGIGQVTTAFATLSLSIVSTWRAYRDLGDAQLAVDRANLKVKKTQEAIKKTTAEIAGLQKAGNKGGLEAQRRRIDLTKLTVALAAAEKKYGKNSLEAKDAALKLKEAQVAGAGSSDKLKAAQAKLEIQQEQLGIAVTNAGEQQERFNDTQQNFYLSILPLGISTMATLTSAFSGFKGMLTGGGGLLGGLGPIALILGGISLAILAFKTNFLGLRDVVGGVIDWIKARFGLWKDTIEKVFNLIKSGEWAGAFTKIKEAAAKFWEDLKKSVPFFGEVEKLVEKIRGGNWKGAFLQIWKAATDAWEIIKKNIPMFGEVEKWIKTMVEAIKNGDWGTAAKGIQDAFNATLGKGIEWIFGKNWKAGLDAAIAKIQAEAAVNKRSVPIQLAMEINAIIKNVTGVDITQWFKDHPIPAVTMNLPLGGINVLTEDPTFNAAIVKAATLIVSTLGTTLGKIAGLMDPYIASFLTNIFSSSAWADAITATSQPITAIGNQIVTAIGGAISTAKGTETSMDDAAAAIWNGMINWFETKMPESTAIIEAIVQSFKDSIGSSAKFFQDVGTSIWNALIEGIEVAVAPFDITGALRGALDKLIIKPKVELSLTADTKPADKSTDQFKNRVERGKYIAQLTAATKQADNSLNKFLNKVNHSTATIKIATQYLGSPLSRQIIAGNLHQHGYQGTVKRPTAFIAGEGGRPEDVTVRPRGSVQRGGSGGGGGFYGTVNVYVDGVLRPARYDMGARK